MYKIAKNVQNSEKRFLASNTLSYKTLKAYHRYPT